MNKRTIAILGATGSIGTQALDMVRRYPDRFFASCLSANTSSEKLFDLVREFRPKTAALAVEPEKIPEDVRFCQWYFGPDASAQALKASKAQDALCAVVGIAGLSSVWTALETCQRVLLANKEALVTAGQMVMARSKELQTPILPVDSEHSAIFQCLQAAGGNPVQRLILTASGGALRDWPRAKLSSATPEDVLRHPNWQMGAKITVDCATMLNKGLEEVEACHLFDIPADKIDVVVHPQSVVHSMVEFEDGAVLAQMGAPDMRGPIGYAMGYPNRLPYEARRLDFAQLGKLTFFAPDRDAFPCLRLAEDALRQGGNACVTLNGANEEAVAAFLRREISFGAIAEIVGEVLNQTPLGSIRSLEDVYAADCDARRRAQNAVRRTK